MTDEVVLDREVGSEPVAAPVEPEAAPEKMLPASRVEELVKKAKLKGRDSLQEELDALKAENASLKQASMGGMAVPVDPEQIANQVIDRLRKEAQASSEARAAEELQREAKGIVDNYHHKMKAGKDSFEDFDQVMGDFRPEAFPNLVFLANQLDNAPAVMYELMNNPTKLATVVVLAERDPKAAENMMLRISSSIKTNEQAKAQEKEVAPPLGRLSSSPTTGQDNGKLTMKDYKRMFKG